MNFVFITEMALPLQVRKSKTKDIVFVYYDRLDITHLIAKIHSKDSKFYFDIMNKVDVVSSDKELRSMKDCLHLIKRHYRIG